MKTKIARQVAHDYDQYAALMQYAGEQMLQRLTLFTIDVDVMLDLGCGPGFFNDRLQKQFSKASLISLDVSLAMLRQNYSDKKIQALAEQLPIKANSIDFVFANFLLPYCEDFRHIFQSCWRVLKPQGLFFFSTLSAKHGLTDMHDIGDALVHAGFIDPVMEVESLELNYSSVEAMQIEMHAVGLDTIFTEPNKTVDVEIVYGHAWCGDKQSSRMNAFGEVSVPVDFIRSFRSFE